MSGSGRDVGKLTTDVWSWLPTFRAVAETEHLPTAAARLHITASAVSRTIRLVEDHLGVPLFNRTGRRLVLNDEGRRLLAALRRGMDEVERGISRAVADAFAGPMRVSSLGLMTNHFVLPALLDLKAEHGDLHPILENHRTSDAFARLRDGTLRLAFTYEPLTERELVVQELGATTAGVYCGQSHPLFDRAAEATIDDVLEHPFSVPQIGDTGQVMDGWPVAQDRKIGMGITLLTTNLAVCLDGRLITVLPDVTAMPYLESGELARFAFEPVAPIPMYAVHRATESDNGVVSQLVERVREEIAAANRRIEVVLVA